MRQLAHANDVGSLDERFQELRRWTYLMMQIHWADIHLKFAEGSEPLSESSTKEDLILQQGHLINFLIHYSKCFVSTGKGRAKIESAVVFESDPDLLEVHERIIFLRHKFAAHNDSSGLDDVRINVVESKDEFVVNHSMGIALPLNEYSYYRKALRVAELYIADRSESHRQSLEQGLGKAVRIPEGEQGGAGNPLDAQ